MTSWWANLLAGRKRAVLLVAALTGTVTGLLVGVFEILVVDVLLDGVSELPLWAIAIMPTLGLAVAAGALRLLGPTTPGTTDSYLQAFHSASGVLSRRPLPARVLAAIATLGSGGPMGLEGPSLYFGASVGAELRSRLRRVLGDVDPRVLMVAGAAAGVAAIFKAPATGAVFALEVPYQDDFARRMLLPALVAAATGYLAFVALHGTGALIPVHGSPALTAVDLGGGIVLGLVAGLVARGFALLIRAAKQVATSGRLLLRVAGSGAVIAVLVVVGDALTGEPVVAGVGYGTIDWALTGEHAVWLLLVMLLLRTVATASTVAGGGVGGLFIPLVVAGALLGRAAAALMPDFQHDLALVVGVAAVLGAGYRVPLAAVVFVAEATGRPGFIVPALLAAVAADLTMGGLSVTEYQRPSNLTPQ
jgi:CIC family chloride channel protein